MKHTLLAAAAIVVIAGSAQAQQKAMANKSSGAPAKAARPAPVMSGAAVTWGPAPAVFAAGAQFAVLAGDPSKAGEYTVRLKMPNGYKVMPHFHPKDEHVTVVSGTFHVGIGDKFTDKGALKLQQGGFITAGAGMHHYAWAEGATVVQVTGTGPFQLTYVNPADDPTHKK